MRGEGISGIAALTFAHAVEIPVQTQHLPHLHQPLLQPHRHHIPAQLRPHKPLPLLFLLVLVLRIRQSRRLPRTGPRRLRRSRAAVKVGGRRGGSGVRKRRRHIVHFRRPAAAGHFLETGDEGGRVQGAGCRYRRLTQRPRSLLLVGRRAVDDAAAAEVVSVVIQRGARFASIQVRVRVPYGQAAAAVVAVVVVVVVVVEVGCEVALAEVDAWTAGAEGGAPAAGVHCSVRDCACRGGDVSVGDCW